MSTASLPRPLHPALVAILAALALDVVACGPVTPPAESASAVLHGATLPAPPLIAEASPSETEEARALAREKGLYPYNLPSYDDVLTSELARAAGAGGTGTGTGAEDASSKSR